MVTPPGKPVVCGFYTGAPGLILCQTTIHSEVNTLMCACVFLCRASFQIKGQTVSDLAYKLVPLYASTHLCHWDICQFFYWCTKGHLTNCSRNMRKGRQEAEKFELYPQPGAYKAGAHSFLQSHPCFKSTQDTEWFQKWGDLEHKGGVGRGGGLGWLVCSNAGCPTFDTSVWWPATALCSGSIWQKLVQVEGDGHCCQVCYNRLADTSTDEEIASLVAVLLPCLSQNEQKELKIIISSTKNNNTITIREIISLITWRKIRNVSICNKRSLGLLDQSRPSVLESQYQGGICPIWYAIWLAIGCPMSDENYACRIPIRYKTLSDSDVKVCLLP